ncbi:hypothetical protein GCM10017771_07890 [Streptomyces capitiformicae]|uniref:Uncharacterized protein n=1 Tax=Streptomyces capitiformicae TaxID=2014920 RepID=A0A919GE53_9ACTN|nr:hypothetical protein GCM10017771_07890 [Streptomyces capitiformicae]
MENHMGGVQAMGCRMFGDAFRRRPENRVGRHNGPTAPTLVRMLEDVAVVTCQIAAAVHFEHELA